MLTRVLLIGLFAMTAVAMFVAMLATEANAGCIKLSSGGYYCAKWITGSEICNGKASGVKKVCDTSGNCVSEILCAVGGTFDASTGQQTTVCNDTNNYFPSATDNCGIQGEAFCQNPGGNSKPEGQPFVLDAVLSETSGTLACTKNGVCKGSVELEPLNTQGICINPNWLFITFDAAKFKARSCYCTLDYVGDPPRCPTEAGGIETCLTELCTVDLTNIQAGETRTYTCTPLPPPPPA